MVDYSGVTNFPLVGQFVGEQDGWNKTTAPNVTENLQPHYFLQYF
jgi:hypothetical protein